VAEVRRRNQPDAPTLDRWEREAKTGMMEAIGDKPRTGDALERENARLRAGTKRIGSSRRWWRRTSR
jgi:hypothetical protein